MATSSSHPDQLAPLPNPIGVFPQFIAQHPVTIVLKERTLSISGDDFHIKDAGTGQSVLIVRGRVMSMSGRKEVSDPQGNPLFTIRKELMSFLGNYYLEDPSGKRFLDVKGKLGFKPKSEISFINTKDHHPVNLVMKGNLFASKADITLADSGVVVARLHRDRWNARDLVGGQQTYYVTVAPGFDFATAAAICICLDEKHHDK
ncbi:MAG: hypothetical protein M1833_002959 [Piccolia ochrophora]|nr:MAG: hypothetical protein M1833_002959 [Piccolia ochrophora]